MSQGHKVHLGAAERRNILHSTGGLYSRAVLGLTHKLRGMPNLFAKGPKHCLASDLTVRVFKLCLSCSKVQEQLRGKQWNRKPNTLWDSQALPSREDIFFPPSELL